MCRVALIILVIGVVLACGLTNQLLTSSPGLQKQLQSSSLWSKLRQRLWLPALVGSRHLEPLPGRIGYVPSRMLSINIGLYVILNIIFSSVSFRTFQPNVFFLSWQFEVCEYVGNRTGTLSLVSTAIAFLFAGRNNLLINLTGWSQTTFLTLHRWSARVATVQAIVHSIVYTLAYWEPGYDGAAYYAAQAAMPFYVSPQNLPGFFDFISATCYWLLFVAVWQRSVLRRASLPNFIKTSVTDVEMISGGALLQPQPMPWQRPSPFCRSARRPTTHFSSSTLVLLFWHWSGAGII